MSKIKETREAYDLSDEDGLVNALCDHCGADEVPYSFGWDEFLANEKRAEETRLLEENEEEFVLPLEKYLEGEDLSLVDLVHICFWNLSDLPDEDINFIRDTADQVLDRHGLGWSSEGHPCFNGREIAGIAFPRSYSGLAEDYWNEGDWFSLCEPSSSPEPDIPDVKLNIRDERVPEKYSDHLEEFREELFRDLEGPIDLDALWEDK